MTIPISRVAPAAGDGATVGRGGPHEVGEGECHTANISSNTPHWAATGAATANHTAELPVIPRRCCRGYTSTANEGLTVQIVLQKLGLMECIQKTVPTLQCHPCECPQPRHAPSTWGRPQGREGMRVHSSRALEQNMQEVFPPLPHLYKAIPSPPLSHLCPCLELLCARDK